jgi:hypothetical protein
MAKSPHSFNKRQREKDKQKKNKEKRERREERKVEKADGDAPTGPEIDWDSAPVNRTLTEQEEAEKTDQEETT